MSQQKADFPFQYWRTRLGASQPQPGLPLVVHVATRLSCNCRTQQVNGVRARSQIMLSLSRGLAQSQPGPTASLRNFEGSYYVEPEFAVCYCRKHTQSEKIRHPLSQEFSIRWQLPVQPRPHPTRTPSRTHDIAQAVCWMTGLEPLGSGSPEPLPFAHLRTLTRTRARTHPHRRVPSVGTAPACVTHTGTGTVTVTPRATRAHTHTHADLSYLKYYVYSAYSAYIYI